MLEVSLNTQSSRDSSTRQEVPLRKVSRRRNYKLWKPPKKLPKVRKKEKVRDRRKNNQKRLNKFRPSNQMRRTSTCIFHLASRRHFKPGYQDHSYLVQWSLRV